jgi:peroxiredoxin
VRAVKSEFDRRGIAIAVVSFAEPARLVLYQEHHKWPFTMLADPHRVTYQEFALKRLSWLEVFSPATLKMYWKLLRQGMKRAAYGKDDIYQSGGDFLLDRQGNIVFAQRSQDPADRPSAPRLLQVIDDVASSNRTPET